MIRALSILILIGSLSGCGGGLTGTALRTAAGAVMDSGPSVNANAQVGKTNSQTIGETRVTEVKVAPVVRDNAFENLNQDNRTSADERTVSADRVETVVVNQIPAWLLAGMAGVILLFGLIGWLSPQPKWMRRA